MAGLSQSSGEMRDWKCPSWNLKKSYVEFDIYRFRASHTYMSLPQNPFTFPVTESKIHTVCSLMVPTVSALRKTLAESKVLWSEIKWVNEQVLFTLDNCKHYWPASGNFERFRSGVLLWTHLNAKVTIPVCILESASSDKQLNCISCFISG